MVKNADNFLSKTKKAFDEFTSEIEKVSFHTTTLDNFQTVSKAFEDYLSQLKEKIEKIDKEVTELVIQYHTQSSQKYNETKNEFMKMMSLIQEEKKILENTKHDYFDSNKNVDEQEKTLEKMIQSKKETKETIDNAQNNLTKLKKTVENNTQAYKTEIEKINKFLVENETKYQSLLSSFRSEEEAKSVYFKGTFEKLIEILNEIKEVQSNLNTSIKSSANEINPSMDSTLYMNKFNYLEFKTKKRFKTENFIDYELFRKNAEMYNNSSISIPKDKLSKISLESIQRENMGKAFISYSSKYENEFISDIKNDNLDKFFNNIISSSNPVPSSEIDQMTQWFTDNNKNSEEFLKSLLTHYKSNFFVKIMNMTNFEQLSNLLIYILNIISKNHFFFDLNYLILFISEKTIYYESNNELTNYYLCKLVSKDKIFKSKAFWSELIETKINSVVKCQLQSEIEKRNQSNGSGQVLSKMKNLFSNSKAKENFKVEQTIMYGQLFNEKQPLIALEIIENYIQHFANFNYDVSESIEVVSNLINKFKLDKDIMNYLIALINSNMFSIKNKSIKLETNKTEEFLLKTKPYIDKAFDKFKDYYNKKLSCIGYSLRYLTPNDFANVLLINKSYNEKLSPVVFKNILLKSPDLPIKIRILIWKSILKFRLIKVSCDYQAVLKQSLITPPHDASIEIIDLDVSRTPFESNVEENRQSVINILKAVTFQNIQISYSQGMNYMASFMLLMTNNETEAFYMFLSMMNSTKYGDLFVNDLDMLKKYFYVFDRLMNILMPELCFYLKSNNITVAYFVSPWFITLFSNAYQWIEAKDNPRVLLKIWDLFLFSGWKSIIKVGIALIKHYESKLLKLNFEDLLNYLINDAIKFEFFQNANYDNLMNIIDNFKIERGLISNIQNEYELKKKIIQPKKH